MDNLMLLIQNLSHGGAERVISRLSNIMEQNYNVYLVVFDGSDIKYDYSGTLVDLKVKSVSGILGKLIMITKRVWKLHKLKKNLKIDVTISFLEGPNMVNILSRAEDKVIVSVRNYKGDEKYSDITQWIHTKFIRLLYNRADKVVAVSQVIKDELVKRFGILKDKIDVIYNPYNLDEISKLAAAPMDSKMEKLMTDNKVIVTMGRLMYQKGHWHLIKAFCLVKESIPNVKLCIIGDGPFEKKLKSMVKECKVERDVVFLGYEKNPFQYIAKSKVYAMPSLFEGFPNALVEAMACGIPVVSTDCRSGPREILYEHPDTSKTAENIEMADYGILTPAFSREEDWNEKHIEQQDKILADILIKVITNKNIWQRYSQSGKFRASQFNYSNCYKRYNELCR